MALAGGTALCPQLAHAQRRRLVGVLWQDTVEMARTDDDALRRGLAESGFVEGPALAFAERYAETDLTRIPALASELASLKPDVIVASGSNSALAVHRAAPDLPVVAVLDGDPVALGLFQSYARPDAMVTGLTLTANAANPGKGFQLLRDLVPGLRGIGLMYPPDAPGAVRFEPEARAATEQLGLVYTAFPVRSMDEVRAAFSTRSDGVTGMWIYGSPLLRRNLSGFVELAIASKTPVMTVFRGFAERGFLASYGPDVPAMWRRIGGYAARVLAGAKPVDLPVEMPTKIALVINLKTAKALGLAVPQSLLARADEVIE
jgi:putative ABC transport system substrate-binding protein